MEFSYSIFRHKGKNKQQFNIFKVNQYGQPIGLAIMDWQDTLSACMQSLRDMVDACDKQTAIPEIPLKGEAAC